MMKDFGHYALAFSIAILIAVIGSNLYTNLVYKNIPVVSNMTVTDVVGREKYIDIRVVGDKNRDCGVPIAIQASSIGSADKSLLSLTFLNDAVLDNEQQIISVHEPTAQAVGKNIDFGWWRLKPRTDGPVLVKVYHKCYEDEIFESVFTLDLVDKKGDR